MKITEITEISQITEITASSAQVAELTELVPASVEGPELELMEEEDAMSANMEEPPIPTDPL